MCNILFDKGGSKKRLFLRTTFKVKIILDFQRFNITV